MNNITATIPPTTQANGKNLSRQKEMVSAMSAVAVINGKMCEVIVARWYMARKSDGASPVYASIWTYGAGFDISGHGRATGYGYHKASAALSTALESAGTSPKYSSTKETRRAGRTVTPNRLRMLAASMTRNTAKRKSCRMRPKIWRNIWPKSWRFAMTRASLTRAKKRASC